MSVGETIKQFFTGGKPEPVGKDEKILEYDKANLAAYRKMQEAGEVLRHANDKGFRKPSHKQLERATEIVQDYKRTKARTFLEEQKKRTIYYGIEIRAHFEEVRGTGLIKPSLTLGDFDPFKGIAEAKPWSEALEENLAARINCTHKLNEDETACEKCALNPENWGSNNEGVTNDYQDKQRAKIQAEKEKELACSRGEHELNQEAIDDPENAPMQFCVKCRKPKSEWQKAEDAPTEQTAQSQAAEA